MIVRPVIESTALLIIVISMKAMQIISLWSSQYPTSLLALLYSLPIDNCRFLTKSSPQSVSPLVSLSSPLSSTDTHRLLIDSLSQLVILLSSLLPLLPIYISRSSADAPTQPILSSCKLNVDNRSFQKQ